MLRNFLFLALLGLCCGQLDSDAASDDYELSQVLLDVFGKPPETTTQRHSSNNDDPFSCITAARESGKCVPTSSCVSENAANNINYVGKCENSDDICCPLDDVKKKCGWGALPTPSESLDQDKTIFAEYPWIVAVLEMRPLGDGTGSVAMFTCSGSLIHPQVVMTTAHNVRNLRKLRIRAGEWDTTATTEPYPHQERNVIRTIVHEAYNTRRVNLHNDIALLVLDKPVGYKPNVNTVCLPSNSQAPGPGTRCFSSGWGRTKFGNESEYQNILKKVELSVIRHSDCQRKLRKTRVGPYFKLHRSFLCAEGENGKDTCTGDGGSPLMYPVAGESGRFMAGGMVAWGIGCGSENPAVYVDVAHFKTWIDQKMTELGYLTDTYTI